MKRLLFGMLCLAICGVVLNAAGPPDRTRRTTNVAAVKALVDDADDVQDVMYVGQPHPVMLRMHLRVNKKSAVTHWGECMEKYFALLDRNGNKWLDRNEVARAPSAQQMVQLMQGSLYLADNRRGAAQASVGITDLDADRDGKVTLDEFKEYYRGNNAGPISMQAQSQAVYYNPDGQQPQTGSDAVFDLLDTNNDGKLSKAEIEAAQKTLTRFDRDDNELVSQQEIGLGQQPGSRRLAAPIAQPRQTSQPSNLIVVAPDSGKRMTNKLAAARELIKRYDKDNDDALSLEEIGFTKELFTSLDRNDDAKLSAMEVARWIGGKPAGEFSVQLSGQGAMMARDRMAARKGVDEMSVNLEGVRINVVQQPTVRFTNERYFQQLFDQLAENKGFVTRKQIEADRNSLYLLTVFDLGDRDSDGKLTEKELKAVLETMTAMRGSQVSMSIVSTGNGLFQVLDANSDGFLSPREMRMAWKRLVAMDRNKDGEITRNEFPQQFQLTVAQGPSFGRLSPQGMGGMARPAGAVRGPLWFRKMDRNGDGDVSRTEWLGSKEDFDEADTDKDDTLSAEEAEAYDAKVRARVAE